MRVCAVRTGITVDVTPAGPLGWTQRNRGWVLRSLYTIPLPADQAAKTRFPESWRLVG